VWLLRGDCRIVQGADAVHCDEAVLWIDHADAVSRQRSKMIAYLEGHVSLDLHRGGKPVRITAQTWFGRFYTVQAVQVRTGVVAGKPDVLPGIYQRGTDRRNPAPADVTHASGVEPAQYVTPGPRAAPIARPLPPGVRRVRVLPRGDVPVQAAWFPGPLPNQWIAVLDSGVNLIVDGLKGFSSIDVSTDRLVIWTESRGQPDLTAPALQDEQAPLEFYLEGNVVFRQGERVVYADRMYYDVRNHLGTVLNADMLTPVPKYSGLLRLHAEILQQTGPDRFFAQDAFVTSSRMGLPGYRLQSSNVTYEDHQQPVLDPYTGQPLLDPLTKKPIVNHDQEVTGQNNFVYIEDVPVFYWPVFATELNEPSFFLRRVMYKQDNVFGTQILTDFDPYQLLGMKKPLHGTDWDLSLNYLSMRGFAYGTTYSYRLDSFFGIPGKTAGLVDTYTIRDRGFDVLGADRSHVTPDETYRYRLLFQHREQFPEGFQLTAELGKVSDRNFLEEYFKHEFDELKDQTTDVELKRYQGNMSYSILGQARTNDFVTESDWLPRADHFWLGQSLFGDNPTGENLTLYEHTSLGYADFHQLTAPNPANNGGPFSFLPWEASSEHGSRLVTRNELDYPVQLGPVKVVPYALGEVGHWGEDLSGNSLDRAYYQAGVRATMPMWRVDPCVESALWNVHGLAHKVDFELEVFNAQSNRNLSDLPLYDPVDDWTIEAFRRRFATTTFGIPSTNPASVAFIPKQFDERFYAVRTDMEGSVTAPSMEIADDLTEVRAGIHQRWQTKRGMPENRHIVDWIELDTDVTFYPDASRDNFGSAAGLWDYDFRWHVGDRLTLVSDGIFDFFDQGQRIVSIGAFLSRPPRGNLFIGYRILEGPITDQIVTTSYNYQMSPKWVSSLGVSADLSEKGNIGEFLRITRVGESLLLSGGFSYDPARSSVSATFAIEPRFLPKGQLGQVGGARILPAGAMGLE
jgi:hypothetical protein